MKQNKANDYLLDREYQRTESFGAIRGVNTQDMAVQESMGPIYDRSKEHLGSADTAIIMMRRQLMQAARDVQEGKNPLGPAVRVTGFGRRRCSSPWTRPGMRACAESLWRSSDHSAYHWKGIAMLKNFSICVGTLGMGLWQSPDGGQSWARGKLWNGYQGGRSVFGLSVHPNDPQVVWAGTDDGLYRSEDRGKTLSTFPARWTSSRSGASRLIRETHPPSSLAPHR